MYHSELISLRLPGALLRQIDHDRGGTPRSAYIRKIIERSVIEDQKRLGTNLPAAPDPIPDTPFDTPAVTVDVPPMVTVDETEAPDTSGPIVKKHFHQPGDIIKTWFHQGKERVLYHCKEEGCAEVIER